MHAEDAQIRLHKEIREQIDELRLVFRIGVEKQLAEPHAMRADIENRILAGDALASMMSNGAAVSMSDATRCRIAESFERLLEAAEPPVLHDAAERWQQQLKEAAGVAGTAVK